jgi:hypothetical protein
VIQPVWSVHHSEDSWKSGSGGYPVEDQNLSSEEDSLESHRDENQCRKEFHLRRSYVCQGYVNMVSTLSELDHCSEREWIPNSIEILTFSKCKNRDCLSSIVFESNSRLTRIESNAFASSSLQSIVIPSPVRILGSKCFSSCKSLLSISFESNSQLT